MLDYTTDINWNMLDTAYGRGLEVPDQIMRLNSPVKSVRNLAEWELYGNIYHQGTLYEATPFAVPFLIELLYCGSNCDKSWINGYLEDIVPADQEGPYNLQNVYEVCQDVCNKEHGYTKTSFLKVKSELAKINKSCLESSKYPELARYGKEYKGKKRTEILKILEKSTSKLQILQDALQPKILDKDVPGIIKYVDLINDLNLQNPTIQIMMGKLLVQLKRPGMGLQCFKKSLSISKKDDPKIHKHIANAAYKIGDIKQAYNSMNLILEKGKKDIKTYCLYPFFAAFYEDYEKASQHIQFIMGGDMASDGINLAMFFNSLAKYVEGYEQHIQHCGYRKHSSEDILTPLLDYLVEKLEKQEDNKNRSNILKQIYFVNKYIYPPPKLEISELKTTKGLISLFDDWIRENKDYYWLELNQLAWDSLSFAEPGGYGPLLQAISKEMEIIHYDAKDIGEYLIDLGKEFENKMMECFGMDIYAASLALSDEKSDLVRAESLLKQAKSVSEDYYTPETLEKIQKKLDNLSS